MRRLRAPRLQGWMRKLENGRLEIFLRTEGLSAQPNPYQDVKIRASGREAEMYELVDWFEEKTGLRVDVPDRPRTGPKPPEGQMALVMNELPSDVPPTQRATVSADG